MSKTAPKLSENEMVELFTRAWMAGEQAVEDLGEVHWYPCGFAQVIVKPGTSRFAKWLKQNVKYADNHYKGGVSFSIMQYNQSMTCKGTHARAMASVLRKAGINAQAETMID